MELKPEGRNAPSRPGQVSHLNGSLPTAAVSHLDGVKAQDEEAASLHHSFESAHLFGADSVTLARC